MPPARLLCALYVLLCAASVFAEAPLRRYLYMSSPDGAQKENRSGSGILVFDIDNDYAFVKRYEIPVFKEGIRGMTGNQVNKALYYGTTNLRLGCFDLEKGEVRWDRKYDSGCDRSCMTPDGTELWISDQKGKKLFIFSLDALPPSPMGQVDLNSGGHGWVCFSLDGRHAWCHTPDVFDVKTKKKVASLSDEHGKPFASSKFIEVHFRGDKVVRVGSEFGLGRMWAGSR